MARKFVWLNIKNTVKRVLQGNSSQSKNVQKSSSSKTSKSASSKSEESKGSTRKAYVSAVTNKKEQERKERQEQKSNPFKASERTYKSSGESVKSSAPKAKAGEDYKTTLIRSARNDRDLRNTAYKQAVDTVTKNKYNVDQSDRTKAKAARQRIKSGDMASDPLVAAKSFEYYPIQNLAGRKFAQGMSFGTLDLAERKLAGDRYKESIDLYRKQQEEHPWISAGAELAGGLVGYSLTGGMSQSAGSAIANKVFPKASTAANDWAIGRLVGMEAIKKSARKEAIRAAEAGLINAIDDEVINQFSRNIAGRIVKAIGEDAAINATTGALYDIANAYSEYLDGGSVGKSLAQSAAANVVLGTLTTLPPALRTSKGIINRTLRDDTREFVEQLMSEGRFEEAAEAMARADATEAIANEAKAAVPEPEKVEPTPAPETKQKATKPKEQKATVAPAEEAVQAPTREEPKVIPAKERLFTFEVKNADGEVKEVTVRAMTKQQARQKVTSRNDVKSALLVNEREIPAKKNQNVATKSKTNAKAESKGEVKVEEEVKATPSSTERAKEASRKKNEEIKAKAAEKKAKYKQDAEVFSKGKDKQSNKNVTFGKDSQGYLWVGNPKDESSIQYFGRDIPENRAKAEQEFNFLTNKKTEDKSKKKRVRVTGETSEVRKLEYGKKMRENRLSELEGEAKGSSNLSDREQERLQNSYLYSLERKQKLEARINEEKSKVKKLREEANIEEILEEDAKSGFVIVKDSDGQIVVTDLGDRIKFFKGDEYEKAKKYYDTSIEYANKKAEAKASKGKKSESKSKTSKGKKSKTSKKATEETKAKSKKVSEKAVETTAVETDTSIARKIKSLENKIENTEKNLKRFDEVLEKKKAEGKSEKSIKYTQSQRADELKKQKDLKKELAALKKGEKLETLKADNVKAKSTKAKKTEVKKAEVEEAFPYEGTPEAEALVKSQEEAPAPRDKALKEGAEKKPPEKKISKAAQERERKEIAKKRVNSLEKKAKKEQNIYERGDTESLKDLVNTEEELRQAYRDAGMSRTDEYRALRERQVAHQKELLSLEKEAKRSANKKPSEKALKTYKRNQAESLPKAQAEAANTVNIGGREYAAVGGSKGSMFDEASTRTTREKPKFTSNEDKAKAEKKKLDKKRKAMSSKLKSAENKVTRMSVPRGEKLHKGVVRRVTGKELDETVTPQTVQQMLDGQVRWANGQASDDREVVSLAGIKLANATTDEAQRARLKDLEANDKFNYFRIKNDEKYEEAYREIANNFDAVAKRLQDYADNMETLPQTRAVDTHYEAHAMMKYLRKELSNPNLSAEELKKVQRVYDASACLTQRLSSISGQINQFQGVMVHCTPEARMRNAVDNIVDMLDSSRGFRRKTKMEIDGKLTSLAQNPTKRRQQIRKLVYNDKDIQSTLVKIGEATNKEEYGEAMEELMLKAYKLDRKTAFDYLQQWRYLAMLGNPKTHFRNILGNVTFGGVRTLSNTVRGGLENLLQGYAARHGLELQMHGGFNAKSAWQAQGESFAFDDAGKNAWASFKEHKKEILGAKKYDNPEVQAFLLQLNTKALAAEDDFFRQRSYIEQYTKGYYKYERRGVKITKDIEKRLHEEALRESQIATFNEFSELAQMLAKSQKGLYNANATAGQKAVAIGSNALLPFTKIPANILKQSVNYSPAGIIKGFAHIRDAARSGDSALLNQAIDEFASGLTGTAIAAAGYMFGKYTDYFTTNAGSEDAAAQFKKRQGVQNYSVMFTDKDGTTKSITMDWLVPTSSTFFFGVELANQFKNGIGGVNWGELVGDLSQVTSRVIDPVLETSMLSSIYNIVENSRKSASYDDQQSFLTIALRELAQSLVSSYIPTLQGQIARTAYSSDKMVTGDDDWGYFLNSMKVKMGLAGDNAVTRALGIETLGEDVDAYGEVKNKKETTGDYAKSFLRNAVLPWNVQEVDLTETDKQKIKEYEDYVAAGGDPADKEYLFPKKQYRNEFSYGKTDDNKTDIKMTNKEVSLYNQAKTKGGAEGMRVVLESVMFNRYEKDENGKRTVLKNGYTQEQKEALIKQFEGKSLREVEEWLWKQPQFRSATEEERRKALNALWSYSQQGKSQGAKRVGEQAVVLDQNKDIDEYNYKNELSKKKQEALDPYVADGILTYGECVEFARMAGKTYYYEDDEGGSSKTYYNKKQMLEYLESKGLSPEKAEALYNAFKASNAKAYGESSSRKGRRGYGRRRYRRGGGGSRSAKTSVPIKTSDFKASKVTYKDAASALKTRSSGSKKATKVAKTPTVKVEPPKVKMKKYEV